MTTQNSTLIVPVDISAIAVSEKDYINATAYFAGANAVFNDQTGPNNAFIGANVNRALTDPPAQPLEAGIHLHWALPSIFTRYNSDQPNQGFLAAPNRWLISRILVSGSTVTRRSWVVLGDKLNDAMPAGQTSVTLPTWPTSTNQNYQHCGEYQDFDEHWTEPAIPTADLFRTQAGMSLTAVANGHPVFASFYPNSRGVFGFTDPVSDITVPAGQSVDLVYSVTGWYSDAENDPLNGGKSLADIEQTLLWTFVGQDDATPDSTLLQGSLQDISWAPDKTWLEEYQNGVPPTIDLDLTIANNPIEAISCYLQNRVQPSRQNFQTFLNGYLDGLLNAFATPQPGQIASLYDGLHQARFSSAPGGEIYTVVSSEGTPVALPLALGDALNDLNESAQTCARLSAEMESFCWQLFADWYRIFLSDPTQQQNSYQTTYAKYQALDSRQQALNAAQSELSTKQTALTQKIPSGSTLRQTAAPRYWQPNDPVFLLSGTGLQPSGRLRSAPNATALLPCQLDDQLITRVGVGGIVVTAANFAAAALPVQSALPEPALFASLLFETLMLNATLLSAISTTAISLADIQAALSGAPSDLTLTGTPPTVASINGFIEQPWIPIMAQWSVAFEPIYPTCDPQSGALKDYPPTAFTSQFTIDQNAGGDISLTPTSDPSQGSFSQVFTGSTLLSSSVVKGVEAQLAKSQDPVLAGCLQALQSAPISVQPLSGFNAALLMQDLVMQLNVAVPDTSQYSILTQLLAPYVQAVASRSPNFNGYFNPFRAGYLKLEVTLVDIYGQKRTVTPQNIYVADSLTIHYQGAPVPHIAWLPPRLTQPGRLLFRFLAADGAEFEEMNSHPATSPICGWLIPNHLSRSLFVYRADGASLGYLYLAGGDQATGQGSTVMWQSAPGNNQTINDDIQTVMQTQQPQLKDLVLDLSLSSGPFFSDVLTAIDCSTGAIVPQQQTTDTSLSLLIGRPLALVQTALTLENRGTPQSSQSWNIYDLDPVPPLAETRNAVTDIAFPVVLGNMSNMEDGLVGYFRQSGDSWDFANFYAIGARTTTADGVQGPTQNTVTLTLAPGDGTPLARTTKKLLMLIDPHGAIHATTGYLPLKSIRIPPDMFVDTLRTLEMTFLTAPVLKSAQGLTLPVPAEAGYVWSWVQEVSSQGRTEWEVIGDLSTQVPKGPWRYSPQTLVEGWLRLNPNLLSFVITNQDGKALLAQGINSGVVLTMTNSQGRAITFSPATPGGEGSVPAGSVFYIHFGTAVPQSAVQAISVSAAGWTVSAFNDALYGSYLALTVTRALTLDANAAITFKIDNLTIATSKQQIAFQFDYYGITSINDGIYMDRITVPPPARPQ